MKRPVDEIEDQSHIYEKPCNKRRRRNNEDSHVGQRIPTSGQCSISVLHNNKYNKNNKTKQEANTVIATNKRAIEEKIFSILSLFANVIKYLPIIDVIKIRPVNVYFNNELKFEFQCRNFNIFFIYKNKYIIDNFNNEFCDSLEHFSLFYLQSFNIKKQQVLRRAKDDDSIELLQRKDCTCKYLLKVGAIKKKIKTPFMALEEKFAALRSNFDFNIDPNIFDDQIVKKGNIPITPIESIYMEIKHMEEQITQLYFIDSTNENNECDSNDSDSQDSDSNSCDSDMYDSDSTRSDVSTLNALGVDIRLVDMLHLCRYYRFKPYKDQLNDLISNNQYFRGNIHVAYTKRPMSYSSGLYYIWIKVHFFIKLFQDKLFIGWPPFRQSVFSASTITGDFGIFEQFLQSTGNDINKIRNLDKSRGLLVLFSLFLRRNYAEKYIENISDIGDYATFAILFIIQPKILSQFKAALIEKFMLIIDHKNETEFDLIGNARYDPQKRLSYLEMFIDCETFLQQLNAYLANDKKSFLYVKLLQCKNRFTLFDNFQEDWSLDKYPKLKNNLQHQRQIHESFMNKIARILIA